MDLFELSENGELVLNIAHSTQKEVEHPNTPAWVKRGANKLIYTIKTPLTPDEQSRKSKILRILAGKGKPEKMIKDSEHVFEADKYSSYFITTDERILKKRKIFSIREICLPREMRSKFHGGENLCLKTIKNIDTML